MKFAGVKILDLPVLLLSVAALIASVLLVRRGGGDERLLVVRTQEGEFVYPLSKDAVYRIEGAVGISEIEVSGGKARFRDSPCPGKTCVMSGELSEPGAWAACLPNQVFIRIEGKSQELDAVAR
ncbi:MAG: NusG domain II-containing protein [Treponema sp.]|nr:NusG domain II-containing protein [Treponema sp.]